MLALVLLLLRRPGSRKQSSATVQAEPDSAPLHPDSASHSEGPPLCLARPRALSPLPAPPSTRHQQDPATVLARDSLRSLLRCFQVGAAPACPLCWYPLRPLPSPRAATLRQTLGPAQPRSSCHSLCCLAPKSSPLRSSARPRTPSAATTCWGRGASERWEAPLLATIDLQPHIKDLG